jgi:putative copper export protein
LLFIFAALINGYLLIKRASPEIMKGIIAINILVFTACFVIMAVFTFLPPIAVTGIVLINLLISFIVCPKPTAEA